MKNEVIGADKRRAEKVQKEIRQLENSRKILLNKYHIVFAPKYRRKVFYQEKRAEVGKILRQLCEWKGVNIIQAEVCPDHIHMLVEIPPKLAVCPVSWDT